MYIHNYLLSKNFIFFRNYSTIRVKKKQICCTKFKNGLQELNFMFYKIEILTEIQVLKSILLDCFSKIKLFTHLD